MPTEGVGIDSFAVYPHKQNSLQDKQLSPVCPAPYVIFDAAFLGEGDWGSCLPKSCIVGKTI